MKQARTVLGLLAATAMVALAGEAGAEDWLDTGHVTLIDGDSIHLESDGLVHFMEKDKYHHDEDGPNTPREGAVDCVKKIAFSAYAMDDPDWRAKGDKVLPGTMGGALLEFVCSRVK